MKIGITTRYIYEDGIQKQFVNTQYIDYIEMAGFTPVILPITSTNINELLELCDCFLITGGADLEGSWYNMSNHPTMVDIEYDMDALDKKVIDYAKEYKKPLFGICRGLQAINVFLGGTLHQDIEGHKSKPSLDYITYNKNGKLFSLLPTTMKINSYHHQAINKLAEGLISCGESNGCIEAVEHETLPIFAVQWHPEKLDDELNKQIILEFAKFCKK